MWSLSPSVCFFFFFHLAYCFQDQTYYFQDPCCCMYKYFFSLCYQIMFHFMDILHWLLHSSVDVHCSYFYFLAISIIFLWKYKFFMNTYFHFSSWELLGHMLTSKFLKNCLFSIWLQYFTFPLAMYESSKFSTLMLTLFCLFDYSILLGINWGLIVVWFIFS